MGDDAAKKRNTSSAILTIAGTVAFYLIAGLDAYSQLKTTGRFEPRDWEILVVTSTLGVGVFNLTGRKP